MPLVQTRRHYFWHIKFDSIISISYITITTDSSTSLLTFIFFHIFANDTMIFLDNV
jgi:hypothetical protein